MISVLFLLILIPHDRQTPYRQAYRQTSPMATPILLAAKRVDNFNMLFRSSFFFLFLSFILSCLLYRNGAMSVKRHASEMDKMKEMEGNTKMFSRTENQRPHFKGKSLQFTQVNVCDL